MSLELLPPVIPPGSGPAPAGALPRFCVDCAHYAEAFPFSSSPRKGARCTRPKVRAGHNLVTGAIIWEPRWAPSAERSKDGLCGNEGKFWEPK